MSIVPGFRLPGAALLLGFLAFSASACKKTSTPPAPVNILPAADTARSQLAASVTLAPLGRTLPKFAALAKALGLPFSEKTITAALAAKAQLSAGTLALVDLSRPVGMAVIAAKDRKSLQAVALTAKSAADAENFIIALGATEETSQGARRVKLPDGTSLWLFVEGTTEGTTIVGSATKEGLLSAGALAREAQRPTTEDFVATVYPDALARAEGTDVKTALTKFRQELQAQQDGAAAQGGPPITPAMRASAEVAFDSFLTPLADVASADIAFTADPQKGLRFDFRLRPRAGSPLAQRIREPTPYTLEPALVEADHTTAAAMIVASGSSAFWLDVQAASFAAQAKAGVVGAQQMGDLFARLKPHLGGVAAVVRFPSQGIAYDLLAPTKDPATAKAAFESAVALATAPAMPQYLTALYGPQAPRWKTKREQGNLRTEITFPTGKKSAEAATMMKALFGTQTFSGVVTTTKHGLAFATEPGAKTRLGAPSATSITDSALADALAETKGDDGFMYIDLLAILRPATGLLGSGGEAQMIKMLTSMPGFDQLKVPLVISYRGGENLAASLRVPMVAITNVATFIRPFAAMAAPAQAPETEP